MMTLRCTQKLLHRLPPALTEGEKSIPAVASTALGNWYATILFTRPTHLILSVSERSRLCLLLSAHEPKTLVPRFHDAVGQLLRALAVPDRCVQQELAQMQEVHFGSTLGTAEGRSVLGSLNDFSRMVKAYYRREVWQPHDLSVHLSEVPCGPLGMDSPREVTLSLLKHAYSHPKHSP
jgi:hypothetical protein